MLIALAAALAVAVTAQPEVGASSPAPDRVEWVRSRSFPFATCEAGNGFEDLQPLKQLIGDARIVALGEGTHGTREFFQTKHRLMEFLATEMGFTIFSIEANMPEAYAVDGFVSHGEGDPEGLITGMYFWTWRTTEVADMVRWMRRFNAADAGRHVSFTGFDMQTPDKAAKIAVEFLEKADPEYAATAKGQYAAMTKARPSGSGASFGVVSASFPVAVAAGKKIKYSGWIKTENVSDGYAGLWWRVDGKDGVLAFDNMGGRGPAGTTPWALFSIEMVVPADAGSIVFGTLMPGKGKAWFDGLEIEVDGQAYAGDQFDLDFEGPALRGFADRMPDRAPPEGYTAKVDAGAAHSGKQSLSIQSVGPVEKVETGGPTPAAAVKIADEVLRHMEAARDGYLKEASAKDVDWAIQNARVVAQCAKMNASSNGYRTRDECMAQNVKWILEQAPPGSKIVLWAHNGHVNRAAGCMGSFLNKMYGKDMVVIGFAGATGEYTAVGASGLGRYPMEEPPAGSLEWYLRATGQPRLIMDVRNPPDDDPTGSWLADPVPMRSIGAMAMDEQFHPMPVSVFFDAVVYVERTTPARTFKR